jgi:hypothetical protein
MFDVNCLMWMDCLTTLNCSNEVRMVHYPYLCVKPKESVFPIEKLDVLGTNMFFWYFGRSLANRVCPTVMMRIMIRIMIRIVKAEVSF